MDDDLTLWRRWRDHRDQRAFAALYDRKIDMLIGVVLWRFGPAYLRRERHTVQSAIDEMWAERLPRAPNPQEPLDPLLRTILLRLLIDAGRGAPPERGGEEIDDVSREDAPLDAMIATEDQARLLDCIARLPGDLAAVLRLRVEQGKTLQKAADELGVSLTTVWQRERRMKEWIARCMDAAPGGET